MKNNRIGNAWNAIGKFIFGTAERKLYFLLALYCVILYLPYVLKGGLIYDDWAVAKLSRDCEGLFRSVSCFWPGYPDRPLAALYYSVCSNLFSSWASGYIIFTVTAWIGAVSLMFRVFKERIGVRFATVFFVFAAVPALSTTVIFSPAMQGIGAIAFLMWAVSFYALNKYLSQPSKVLFILVYLFLLASLALYESSLPLFALTALWPLYVSKQNNKSLAYYKNYIQKYLFPIGVVLLILVSYQHFYVQQYYDYISKVRFSSMDGHVFDFVLRVLFNSAYVFIVSTSTLVAGALLRMRHYGVWYLIGAVAGVWFVAKAFFFQTAEKSVKKGRKTELSGILFFAVGCIVLGVGVLHFVAVSPPTSVGYNNRGVVSLSIALSICLALLWEKYISKKKYLVLLFIIFTVGYILSFAIQRDNYIAGTKTQKDIRSQAIPQINKANQDAMVVLAEVPTYTEKNFNNETIFSDEVLDWGNYLRVYSDVKSVRGISLSPGRVNRNEVSVVGGKLRIMTYPEDVPIEMVWYFDTKHMSLQKVTNEDELTWLLKRVQTQPQYDYLFPVDARVRNDIRNWISSY